MFVAVQVVIGRAQLKGSREELLQVKQNQQDQLVLELVGRFSEERFRNAFEGVAKVARAAKKPGQPDWAGANKLSAEILQAKESDDRSLYLQFRAIADFFESLAWYTEHESVQYEAVRELMGGTVTGMWRLFEPTVKALRHEHATAYTLWQTLAERM